MRNCPACRVNRGIVSNFRPSDYQKLASSPDSQTILAVHDGQPIVITKPADNTCKLCKRELSVYLITYPKFMITQDNKTCLPYKFIDVPNENGGFYSFDGFLRVKSFDLPETGPFLSINRFYSTLALPGKNIKMLTDRMFTINGVVAACFATAEDWEFIIVGENGEVIDYVMADYPKFRYSKINGQLIKYNQETAEWNVC